MGRKKKKLLYIDIDEKIIDDNSSMSAGWMRNEFYSSPKK